MTQPAAEQTPPTCPKCHAPLPERTVVCVRCGLDLRLGPSADAQAAGRAGLALVVCGAAAVLAGVVWALLALWLRVEVGWLAWGIGLLAGFCVTRLTKVRGLKMGLAAAGLALLGLVVGKLLIFQWVTAPKLADHFRKDPETVKMAVLAQMSRSGEFTAEDIEPLLAWRREGKPLPQRIEKKLADRMAAMSCDDTDAAIRAFAQKAASKVPLHERVRMLLTFWDALWAFFAAGTAFRMAGGQTTN